MSAKRADAVAKSGCATLLLAGTLAAGVFGCRSPLTAQQAEGKRLFDGRCAHCHMENDLDLKPAPPEIRGALARSRLPSGAPATNLEVMRVVLNGKNKMPSFAGRFTEPQMEALLAYLRMPR